MDVVSGFQTESAFGLEGQDRFRPIADVADTELESEFELM